MLHSCSYATKELLRKHQCHKYEKRVCIVLCNSNDRSTNGSRLTIAGQRMTDSLGKATQRVLTVLDDVSDELLLPVAEPSRMNRVGVRWHRRTRHLRRLSGSDGAGRGWRGKCTLSP